MPDLWVKADHSIGTQGKAISASHQPDYPPCVCCGARGRYVRSNGDTDVGDNDSDTDTDLSSHQRAATVGVPTRNRLPLRRPGAQHER